MFREAPAPSRTPHLVSSDHDLVIVGGGVAGCCCAIAAARAGLRVLLMHDRPVLGGNASSEVRLWILGATVHMGSNNRWTREGGVIDEILTENLWRNPEGNPVIFDTVLLEKVVEEPRITLLLNTACHDVIKHPLHPDRIASIAGFCSQNQTRYLCSAPLFVDASGDGLVGFMAGAAFRMGAEPSHEFKESFAPDTGFGHLLGHSIYFYSRDTGRPVQFVPPSYALSDIEQRIPRFRQFNAKDHGCKLWWIEYGGRLDTIRESESIKWELWRVVYGVWNYIKNSGKFPEAETLTLDWVGHIPGKRESRRFEGDYILRQNDIVGRRQFEDAVAFGGWSIDLHPADGVYSEKSGSLHLHAKGIYSIPYRCYYSRNLDNLFFAGRIISASHVAFGSTRVMATCAHGAQAVAAAAAVCHREGVLPREVTEPQRFQRMKRHLLRTGHHLLGQTLEDPDDLAPAARLSVTSSLQLAELPFDGAMHPLSKTLGQLLPLPAGVPPRLVAEVAATEDAILTVSLRHPSDPHHHTPDVVLETLSIPVRTGPSSRVEIAFQVPLPRAGYAMVCFEANPHVSVRLSTRRVTGILRVDHRTHVDYREVGGDAFEMFCPERRPHGLNIALMMDPPLEEWPSSNLTTGLFRPTQQTNAWVAALDDPAPTASLRWSSPQTLSALELFFDTDSDHAMESVLWQHPERVAPFCIKRFRIVDASDRIIHEADNHHQTRLVLTFDPPLQTERVAIQILETWGAPAALFSIKAFGPECV